MTQQNKHVVTLPDGRQLEVIEAGDKHSPAILVHNGTPSSALLFKEHVTDAVDKGLRIISYARPGYGSSTRNPGRSVASAAQDTADLANALGIDKFATWGISGGGPHVLACAALLPDRIIAASCLAGVAPYDAEGLDFLAGMGEDNVEEFTSAAKGEETLKRYLEPQVPDLLGEEAQAIAEHMDTLLSGPDKAVFTGEFGEELALSMQEALRTGVFGWLDDDLAFAKNWGFSLDQIKVPVQIWQGQQDLMVPYSHGEWLAKHLPQAETHLTAEDGHLTLYRKRISQVHEWLASHF